MHKYNLQSLSLTCHVILMLIIDIYLLAQNKPIAIDCIHVYTYMYLLMYSSQHLILLFTERLTLSSYNST